MLKLEGKVALVTGGGSGIGRAVGRLFAEEGAKVIVADIDRGAARASAEELRALGAEACDLEVDVSKPKLVEAMVQGSLARFGRIDTLYHGAGVYETGLITDIEDDQWDRVIDINLTGTFLVLKHVIKAMVATGGGTIVTMGSVAGFAPFPDNPAYVASKAGTIMLTKAVARDYGEFGIRANVVCPGPVEGPLIDRALARVSDAGAEQRLLADRTLLKRLATPLEIAHVVLFLASDDSSYITGDSILIDGGKLTMNK